MIIIALVFILCLVMLNSWIWESGNGNKYTVLNLFKKRS